MAKKIVGIDAIASFIPKLYIPLTEEWAEDRSSLASNGSVKNLRNKVTKGIGIAKISVPDFHEDAVTLAANAVDKLLDRYSINLQDVGSIIAATESAVDQSKPMSSYILGLLQKRHRVDLSHLNCFQVQFACIGATYAIEHALHRLLAGVDDKKYHIVVSTDLATYPLHSAGEATQGAGSVAMLISENPRLLEIDPYTIGTCSVDESDFYRPNFLKSAIVDGKHSISVYCNCVEKALDSFLKKSRDKELKFENFSYFLFHLPFPKMAEYAAARIFRGFWLKDKCAYPIMSEIENDVPAHEEILLRRNKEFKELFRERVKPSLLISEQIGNIYSGSLYMSIISLIESCQKQSIDLSGQEVLLTSYGSGSSAKVFRCRFVEGINQAYQQDVMTELADVDDGGLRTKISLKQYEALHQHASFEFVPEEHDVKCTVQAMPVIKMKGHKVEIFQPQTSIIEPKQEYYLRAIGDGGSFNDIGYRYYDDSK